ncbi:MAG: transcriptional regulator, IclR family, partial [Devosia sp.]|uniref:IclR family transcriptional regulator domain-containing protein n=1 Tax=Devosia sp. TaxID=1871048 RepID=UPI00261D704E
VFGLPLKALTEKTITDAGVLRAEIERIRQRFYSIDDQEVVMGVYCVSVPILDRTGTSVGAISVTGPSVKKPGPEVQPVVALLWDACEHVSRRLGFSGEWPPVAAPAAARMTG